MVIAIDGFASSGKSTLAKTLAKNLGFIYVDTGAMYRSVTLFFMENNIDYAHHENLTEVLENLKIHFQINPETLSNEVYLNDTCVEDQIRTLAVSEQVSPVSTLEGVREKLVAIQHKIGAKGNIVMDGRDIGTVVFPNAELKFFITATIEARAKRRYEELMEKGLDVDYNDIKTNLLDRDKIDSSRAISPLRKADDATEIDTTSLNADAVLAKVSAIVSSHLSEDN